MKISATMLAAASMVAAQNATINNACTSGLHFIVARGSSEPPGTGRIGWIAGNASQQIPDSTTFPISYPATFDDYLNSEAEGRGNMTNALEDYVKQCPSNKVALLGWSQGAQAIMDTLCGTSEQYFTTSAAISSSYADNGEQAKTSTETRGLRIH
jgi:acetylxylan esterase